MEHIGLIAGNGEFPFHFARCARSNGCKITAVFLKGETDQKLADFVDKFEWLAIGNLTKIISYFKNNNITKAVMAGQVKHNKIYLDMFLDVRALKLMASLKDKRTDSILNAVAAEFQKDGIEFLPSTTFLKELMPGEGVLTKSKPSKSELKDIEFGFSMAKKIAGLDIGQTVVVKDLSVTAVESIEGTDQCIIRGGTLAAKPCSPSAVVAVKVAKPNQDTRFDVPVAGLKTIESLAQVKGRIFAFEADKILFIGKEEAINFADKNDICVIGLPDSIVRR